MASIIGDLIVRPVLELAFWATMEILPTVFYFTALALVFVASLGRVVVEFPEDLTSIGWTGELRIVRSPKGRTTLSPALGVMIGFIIWAIIVSASIIFYANT
jgi:hypothetical protein